MNITHLTSVHPRYDTRIFIKMCSSLATQNFSVNLVVADGKGDEHKNGVKIYDVGAKSGGRIKRIINTTKKVLNKAIELNSDIYHLHDPELLPIGLKLKKMGKKVIFDSHEDVPKDILSKHWIPYLLRYPIAYIYAMCERYACAKFDYIITATPYIRDRFLTINKNTIDINNYPIIDELSKDTDYATRENAVCYVGGLSKIRSITEMIQAMEYVNGTLYLAGDFDNKEVEKETLELIDAINSATMGGGIE